MSIRDYDVKHGRAWGRAFFAGGSAALLVYVWGVNLWVVHRSASVFVDGVLAFAVVAPLLLGWYGTWRELLGAVVLAATAVTVAVVAVTHSGWPECAKGVVVTSPCSGKMDGYDPIVASVWIIFFALVGSAFHATCQDLRRRGARNAT